MEDFGVKGREEAKKSSLVKEKIKKNLSCFVLEDLHVCRLTEKKKSREGNELKNLERGENC